MCGPPPPLLLLPLLLLLLLLPPLQPLPPAPVQMRVRGETERWEDR